MCLQSLTHWITSVHHALHICPQEECWALKEGLDEINLPFWSVGSQYGFNMLKDVQTGQFNRKGFNMRIKRHAELTIAKIAILSDSCRTTSTWFVVWMGEHGFKVKTEVERSAIYQHAYISM